jgi:hypothetical protein
VAKQDCFKLTQDVESFYRDQSNSIKTLINKVSTIQEALSSATVESFYNIMVNEVKGDSKREMDELKVKYAKLEKEKKDYAENTSKVIEQLTLLSIQKDDHIQTMSTDLSTINQSLSLPGDDSSNSPSKKKKLKETKKEVKMKKSIDEMESKIISLQKQVRDNKWSELEQDFIKRIYILEEFMIRSHSLINRRAARHMKTLRKSMNLDLKIFDTLMQKQEWSLKLEENKKQLTNSIKELQEFSKSLGGLNNMEIEHLKSKINEDMQDQKEEKDPDEDDLYEPMHRSMTLYSPSPTTEMSSNNDNLNNTMDLGDDFNSRSSLVKMNDSPTASENPDLEEFIDRFD